MRTQCEAYRINMRNNIKGWAIVTEVKLAGREMTTTINEFLKKFPDFSTYFFKLKNASRLLLSKSLLYTRRYL